jgi:hypothetical protein
MTTSLSFDDYDENDEDQRRQHRKDEISEYRRLYTNGKFVSKPCEFCGHEYEQHMGFIKRRHIGIIGCQVETVHSEYGFCGCNMDPEEGYNYLPYKNCKCDDCKEEDEI